MIKKIKIELIILTLLIVSIFYSYDADIGVNNFFSEIDYGYGKKYLVQFFIKITNLGNSLWYFLILITILCFSYIFKKIPNYQYLRGLSIFGLCYLFCVGFFTQLLKHIIGRPRPNYTNLEEVSFNASDIGPTTITIDKKFVETNLVDLIKSQDLSKFIL